MNYNEIYLLVLGITALLSAGIIFITVKKTSPCGFRSQKKRKHTHH